MKITKPTNAIIREFAYLNTLTEQIGYKRNPICMLYAILGRHCDHKSNNKKSNDTLDKL